MYNAGKFVMVNHMRKLASIRRITDIRSISGADSIECAVIDGWTVVVKKGEYRAGDLAVYFEVDSWITHELAPFLSRDKEPKEYNGVKGERLRTVKLRGQLSQGLLLPLETVFPTATGMPVEGQDVTDILGIQKWERPIPAQLRGIVAGAFPSSVPKTDEERVQNLASDWDLYRNKSYEVTEKLEGSSMTVGIIDGEFIVCSRNLKLQETDTNTFWCVARQLDIERKMRYMNLDNIVLQGELIGEGVQGNIYKLKGNDFYVFAIYDIKRGDYQPSTSRRILVNSLDLKHVPLLNASLIISAESVESILAMADGKSQLHSDTLREGLVFKSVEDSTHWKAVSNQYLLKHG